MSEPRILVPPAIDPRAFAGRADGANVRLVGETMGTMWSLLATSNVAPAVIERAVVAACDAVIAEMSHWVAGSELCRFNRLPPGGWASLSSGFFHVLTAGIALAHDSGGAFDPGAGALVAAWGFGPDGSRAEPSPAEIVIARARNDARRIELDRHARRARQPGGLMLDLSGIAKGHAVDRIGQTLAGLGIRHALIEVGGELLGLGVQPSGEPWWVDVEQPPEAALPPTRVALCGLAIATSGDYRRRREVDGRILSHTIDPRTGRPIDNHVASVTVLHAEAMMADAYATALTVLGPKDGLALAERHALAAAIVERTPTGFVEHVSVAWNAMAEE
ncbi:FAD:protein FMN transferase [Sphingomonas naphthae]|uniref:FAD:protein FMN transferase n=1 Tax=Sphingomonas naphthae TaxID=1813468 RepID=A0ABY7TFD0_9SPHN|nr:FAD:protein FMN transferase [Sphingomonas naphthae]WCT71840.1 FAD:protein FMN transferase [Sphingomonas naphthae]